MSIDKLTLPLGFPCGSIVKVLKGEPFISGSKLPVILGFHVESGMKPYLRDSGGMNSPVSVPSQSKWTIPTTTRCGYSMYNKGERKYTNPLCFCRSLG